MLNREQVRHVAFLARLELSPEEEETFTQQLGSILTYVDQLGELNTDAVDPTFHALDMPQFTRPDQVSSWTELEAIMDNAPDREEEFFKVPRILNTEAE